MAFSVKIFEELSSTNTYLKQLLQSGKLSEGQIIVAKKQTQGYGQRKSAWISQADKDLAMSLYLKPEFLEISQVFFLNIFSSLAIVKVLEKYLLDAEVRIKWPNDVLVNDKKIAGILIENHFLNKKILNSVVGIGININSEKFPETISYKFPPTSILLENGRQINKECFLENLVEELEKQYEVLKKSPELLKNEYEQLLWRKEETLYFVSQENILQGKILGITPAGALEIETTTGVKKTFYSSEVQISRK